MEIVEPLDENCPRHMLATLSGKRCKRNKKKKKEQKSRAAGPRQASRQVERERENPVT